MGEKKYRDFGPIFWVHLLYIITIYASPFWLTWKWMPLGVVGMYLQWYCFGGCFLTKLEFGESEHNSFVWYYLNRVGFKFGLEKVKRCTDSWSVVYLLIVTLIWQVMLGHAAWL